MGIFDQGCFRSLAEQEVVFKQEINLMLTLIPLLWWWMMMRVLLRYFLKKLKEIYGKSEKMGAISFKGNV